MALVLKDRVKETTSTTSTGTYTLAGAVTGYQSFSVVGDGNTTYYTVTDGTNWEVGIGTYTLSGTTLSRDTILASSNSGNAVSWGAGSKDVFLTYPAERSVYIDGSDIVPATTASYVGNVTPIQLRNSSTPGAFWFPGSLSAGELAINTADGKLYFKDSGGTVKVLSQANQIAPLTTKGDLLVNNGTSNVRLPVGTNNHVLTADSTQASGVKWAAAAGGASPITISNKTGAYTVVAGDLGTIINCTSGTFTVSLTAAATLGSGFNCWVWNTGIDVITIDPNSAETIDGLSTLILRRGEGTQIVCDGTNWQTGDKKTMRGYSENIVATYDRPIASGDRAISIGSTSTASASLSIAFGPNSVSSGTGSIALGAQTTASSLRSTAIGANSSSQGSQAVTSSGAMALGGSYASGTDSFAAAVANNTSTYGARGTNSIAIGALANSNNTYSVALGRATIASGQASVAVGYNVSATGLESTVLGNNATASNSASISIGRSTTASGSSSIAIGNVASATQGTACAIGFGALSEIIGKYAYGQGTFVSAGDAQTGTFVLRRATTDATATVLTTNNSAAGTTNQVILPNNSAYAFTGTVVARQQASGGTASAAWKVEGLIRREATAGTTTLVASTVTAISNVPGWTLALSADTTNGGLAVTATGAAATNIRWVATIQTSEVIYA